MKKRIISETLSLALILSAMFSLSGCGTSVQAADLMAGVKSNAVSAGQSQVSP